VVGANGTAELRVLQTSRAVGSNWLVTTGLKPGDQVIMDNLQRVRPGAPVKATPAAVAPTATTASVSH
jgi:membrane fusion protein (multidrug efflux system)